MSKKKHNKAVKRHGQNYADVLKEKQQNQSTMYAEIRSQIDFDAACIAANEVFHMGPGRAKAFAKAMMEAAHEIGNMFIEDSKGDVTLEYSKTKLDERLLKIVGKENFEPYEIRYGRRIV